MKIENIIKANISQITATHSQSPFGAMYLYFAKKGLFTGGYGKNGNLIITKISDQVFENNKLITTNIAILKKILQAIDYKQPYTIELTASEIVFKQKRWRIDLFYQTEIENIKSIIEKFETSFKEKNIVFTLDYKQAKEFLKSECISKDLAQTAFNGVYLDFKNSFLVTTDGKRLNTFKINFHINLENQIIDSQQLIKACKSMKKTSPSIEILERNQVFYFGNTIIPNIEGKFPQYQDVIPIESKHQINIVNYKELIKKIQIVGNASDKESHRMTFEIQGKTMLFRASDVDNYADDFIEIENNTNYEGTFSINYKHLIGLIKDESILYINNHYSPIKIISAGMESVIMPMKGGSGWTKTENTTSITEKTKESTMAKKLTEVLKNIKDTYQPTQERVKELINTIAQYQYEGRLEYLEGDLQKTEFKGLTTQEITILSKAIKDGVFLENEYLNKLYENTKTKQSKKEVLIVDNKAHTQKINLIENHENQPYSYKYIVRMHTDKKKSFVYAPEIYPIATQTEDSLIVVGNKNKGIDYNYKIENTGKPRLHGNKKRGSASVFFALSEKPTFETIKHLQTQFIELLSSCH
ncbi:MAG: hypothetical protein ACRC0X_02065 [Brevinema sp.]